MYRLCFGRALRGLIPRRKCFDNFLSTLSITDEEEDVEKDFEFIPKNSVCNAHKLQLVLQDVFEKNDSMLALKNKTMSILNKFKHSPVAVDLLQKKAHKSLIIPVKTSWNSLAFAYSRILEIFDDLSDVCRLQKWVVLDEVDRQKMKQIMKILEPFKELTNKLQADKHPTISLVYPGIISLRDALQSSMEMKTIRDSLVNSINNRFANVINQNSSDFDPKFLVATALDSFTAFTLDKDSDEISKIVNDVYRTFVPAEQEVIHSPLAKKQKAQSLFTFDTGPRNRTSSQEELHRMSIADQYKKFCNLVRNEQEKTSKFWERNKEDFLELGILAERLLSIPATSGAVERLFSYLTMHTAGRKGNTKSRLVSQKILCSYNEKYL